MKPNNNGPEMAQGFSIHEYLLSVPLHEALEHRIAGEREAISEAILKYPVTTSRPGIFIGRFCAFAFREQKLCDCLANVALGITPVKFNFRGFAGMPTHTIYIKALETAQFKRISAELKGGIAKFCMKDEGHRPFFTNLLQIPLVSRLPQVFYDQLWTEWRDRPFAAACVAKEITLSRKRPGEDRFRTYRTLPFCNMPIAAEQGNLF